MIVLIVADCRLTTDLVHLFGYVERQSDGVLQTYLTDCIDGLDGSKLSGSVVDRLLIALVKTSRKSKG